MKNLEEKSVSNVTEKNWRDGAYTIAFVYSNKGPFVLKGWLGDVKATLQRFKTKGYKFIVKLTLWHKGSYRTIWKTSKKGLYILEPTFDKRLTSLSWGFPYHYKISGSQGTLKLKRMPKQWIPEFDKL